MVTPFVGSIHCSVSLEDWEDFFQSDKDLSAPPPSRVTPPKFVKGELRKFAGKPLSVVPPPHGVADYRPCTVDHRSVGQFTWLDDGQGIRAVGQRRRALWVHEKAWQIANEFSGWFGGWEKPNYWRAEAARLAERIDLLSLVELNDGIRQAGDREDRPVPDAIATGVLLTAIARHLLPYYEARYERDERIPALVPLMERWAKDPSPGNQLALFDAYRAASTVSHPGYFLSMPSDMKLPEPIQHEYPGDHAADVIYGSAQHIILLRASHYPGQKADTPIGFAEDDWSNMTSWKGYYQGPIDSAIHCVSKTLGYRNPDDETSDEWGTAIRMISESAVSTLDRWFH